MALDASKLILNRTSTTIVRNRFQFLVQSGPSLLNTPFACTWNVCPCRRATRFNRNICLLHMADPYADSIPAQWTPTRLAGTVLSGEVSVDIADGRHQSSIVHQHLHAIQSISPISSPRPSESFTFSSKYAPSTVSASPHENNLV